MPEETLLNKLKQRGKNIWETISGGEVYGQTSPALIDRALRVTGQVGGSAGDIIGSLLGKGISNVAEILPEKVKEETPRRVAALKKKIGDIKLPRTGETVREAKSSLFDTAKKSFEELEKRKPHATEAIEDIVNTGDLADMVIGFGLGKQALKKGAGKELREGALKRVLIPPGVKKTALGATGGGVIGAQFGSTPEERRKNALIGALLGGGAANLKNIRKGLKELGEAGQIDVFHGSPHKFKEFDIAKVGTGEGAQSFGHGLYFTSEKDIAKHYSTSLPIENRYKEIGKELNLKYNLQSNNPFYEDVKLALSNPNDRDVGIKATLRYLNDDVINKMPDSRIRAQSEGLNFDDKMYAEIAKDIIEKEKQSVLIPKGKTYTVTLHKGKTPDQYDYLKWERGLTESQADKILKQARKENVGIDKNIINDAIGNKLGGNQAAVTYSYLSRNLGSEKSASDFLLRAGIDGIDYPAGSLSGVKSKARNYVVFDPRAATIEAVE